MLVIASFSSSAIAAGAPSDKELSTMGQGFGKFVGSFMQQMQSDEGKHPPSAGGRLPAEATTPSVEDTPTHREREADRRTSREGRTKADERQYIPYRTYDPWKASAWGDPVLGFDPWARGGSWVEYDWNARKQQYGWSYGGTSPYDHGEFGPHSGAANPYYGAGNPYPDTGSGTHFRERSWSAPFGGGYGNGWDRGGYDRWYPPPEEGFGYRSRGEPPPWSSDRPDERYDRNGWAR